MEYERRGLLKRDSLEKIYGSSAGTIIGLMFLFNIPVEACADYVVKRPWNKFAKIDFLEMNERGGVMDGGKIKEMITPMLLAYDVPLDITFAQARERSTIDLHIISTCLLTMETVDFNFETCPNMPLITAVTMSCSVPPVFSVGTYEGKPYGDGGFSDNFPLVRLLQDPCKPDPATILCINMSGPMPQYSHGMPLMDLMFYLMTKSFLKLSEFSKNHDAASKCKHYIYYESESVISKSLWEKFLYSEEERIILFERGFELARAHLDKLEAKQKAKLECETEGCKTAVAPA
jgi:predicted acylesterase/phospholipase RssA